MIRSKRRDDDCIVVDLAGPAGNAYVLMGYVTLWIDQLHLDIDPEPILRDMRSGDYEHLLGVIEQHFGELVILER